MGRYFYPHIIDNGAGERITFLRVVPGPKGDRLEVENVVTPGSGPPMHVHHFQDEAVTVLKGRIGYTRPEGPKQFGGPGDTVAFKFGMLEIPGAVQRFVFPLLVAIGRLLGKYRRYADAPEPVRR
jgi:hypothetical protein